MEIQIQTTKHFDERCRQRGIKNKEYEILMEYADQESYVGDGVISYSLSKSQRRYMKEFIKPQLIERIKNKAILISEDGAAISVLNMKNTKGKHYRN